MRRTIGISNRLILSTCALGALVCCVAAFFLLNFLDWRNQHQVVAEPVILSVDQGESFSRVARRLVAAGVIDSETKFRLLAEWLGKVADLKVGEYVFEGPVTPVDVLERLSSGDVATYDLLIREGITFAEMLTQLHQSDVLRANPGLDAEQIKATLGIDFVEGNFLPETYQVRRGDTVMSVLERAHQGLKLALDEAWLQRQDGLLLASPKDLLTLASIIEKETGRADDRPLISQVFHSRLHLNMRLQTDPTVIYALGDEFDGDLKRRDLKIDSPFNTYRYRGLPPTPISVKG